MTTNRPTRILRMKQLTERMVVVARPTIFNKLSETSKYYDPTFPSWVFPGSATIGWIEKEVGAWLARVQQQCDSPYLNWSGCLNAEDII